MNDIKPITPLFSYQIEGVNRLEHVKVGALFMEQGTGKTRTALELISRRMIARKVTKVLWLCPCTVKENLRNDIIKHCGGFPGSILIVGIESLSASAREIRRCLTYVDEQTYLIVDESLLVKNPRALRTRRIIQLSEKARYKLILNGTPISRTEADLFSQFYILDKRIFGYESYWSFAANHLEIDETGRVVRALNTGYLVKKAKPYVFQVKKDDVMSLPYKVYHTAIYDLSELSEEEYMVKGELFLGTVDEFKPETLYRLFTVLQLIVSGKRIVSKVSEPIRSEDMFTNLMDNPRIQCCLWQIEHGIGKEKTIIFCKYSDEIRNLVYVLNNVYGDGAAAAFYGDISVKKRDMIISEFRDGGTQFLVANKTCAGFGLNLQFCHKIIFYSNDWDYATRVQAEDRVHRIGQTSVCDIYDIIADNKLDEKIIRCLSRKENLLDSFKKEIHSQTNLKEWLGVK